MTATWTIPRNIHHSLKPFDSTAGNMFWTTKDVLICAANILKRVLGTEEKIAPSLRVVCNPCLCCYTNNNNNFKPPFSTLLTVSEWNDILWPFSFVEFYFIKFFAISPFTCFVSEIWEWILSAWITFFFGYCPLSRIQKLQNLMIQIAIHHRQNALE